MPRRYHRPPGAKRRKPKKTSIPYAFEAAVEPDNGGLPAADTDFEEDVEDGDDVAYEGPVAAATVSRGAGAAPAPVRHIQHDYSYVRSEVFRILIVAAFLVTSLVITAVLRN